VGFLFDWGLESGRVVPHREAANGQNNNHHDVPHPKRRQAVRGKAVLPKFHLALLLKNDTPAVNPFFRISRVQGSGVQARNVRPVGPIRLIRLITDH
jgi:hypothetical protein